MLLGEKLIELKISSNNRKKYEEILNKELKNGQKITIPQSKILKSSRVEVYCTCDECHVIFLRKRVDVKNKTFCGKECRNKYLKNNNPNPPVEKISVNCAFCKKEVLVFPSKYEKQEVFLCSRDCYSKHRSKEYSGDNTYNFQDMEIPCASCKKSLKLLNGMLKIRIIYFVLRNVIGIIERNIIQNFTIMKS